MRDALSRTLNTEIHVALAKHDNKEDSSNLHHERSGSSTSGVYSSPGSVGSDSPDSNSLRKKETVIHHVSNLLVGQGN